jgi:hypothetical protein
MRYLILALLVSMVAAQDSYVDKDGWRCPSGNVLLPSVACQKIGYKDKTNEWRTLEQPKKSWMSKHPTKTKVLFIISGGIIGGVIAYETRPGTCPSIINGYAYNGTPPCPSSNYDPSGNRQRH